MKKMTCILAIGLAFSMLSGCGSKAVKELGSTTTTFKDGTKMEQSTLGRLAEIYAQAEQTCMANYGKQDAVDCTGVDSDQCFMLRLQQQNVALVSAANPTSTHPCHNPHSIWTFMEKEVEEMNASLRSIGHDTVDLGKWVAGFSAIKAAVKKMGDQVHQSVGGDGSPSTAITKEEINNEEVATGGLGSDATGGKTSGVNGGGLADDGIVDAPTDGVEDSTGEDLIVTEK